MNYIKSFSILALFASTLSYGDGRQFFNGGGGITPQPDVIPVAAPVEPEIATLAAAAAITTGTSEEASSEITDLAKRNPKKPSLLHDAKDALEEKEDKDREKEETEEETESESSDEFSKETDSKLF